MNDTLLLLIADLLLIVHFAFIVFVILGLLAIILGGMRGWGWVCNPWFRYGHLAAIAIVVLQSWFGVICPLTIWEMELRLRGGDSVYSGSFVGHWLERLLYYEAPPWVFVVSYSAFGACVVAAWFWLRPRGFSHGK